MQAKIGIIGIVSRELEQDFPGTLLRLSELGYAGIEMSLSSINRHGGPERVAAALQAAGLELITLHTLREELRDNPTVLHEALAATACRHLTISWSPTDTPESVKADASLYKEAAASLAASGVRLCYHHHEHEFLIRFNGEAALDHLLKQTKDALALHADIAWAAFGGVNPVALIERHAGRVPLVHLKDLYDLSVRGCFTTLGTGIMDVRGCVAAALAAGSEWLTVEQDQQRGIQGMELAAASILNLRTLGVVPL